MSYILDALKKIEREKDSKRPDGRTSITGDLFRERSRPPAKGGAWKVIVLIAVSVLVTGAGTWFALRGSAPKNIAVVRPAAVPQPAPAVVATPVPVLVAPTAATPAASSVMVPAMAKKVAAGVDSARPVREPRRVKKTTRPAPSLQMQTAAVVPPPADIKLSGIAWQDERTGRRAVINGFLLKEGAVVSGAKITDIQADKVRFTSAAGQFEIKLDAVLPAEVKK